MQRFFSKSLYKTVLVTIFLLGASFSMTTQATPVVRYDISYQVNYTGCLVELNNMGIFNTATMDSNELFPVLFNYRHGISQYINHGVNKLEVRLEDAAYFLRNEHYQDAYCRVSITAMVADRAEDRPRSYEVLALNFKIKEIEDADGHKKPVLVAEDSYESFQPIPEGKIKRVLTDPTDIYGDQSVIITFDTFGHEIELQQAMPLSWIEKSTPIKDTPEIRRLALEKYKAIQATITEGDWNALKRELEPGLSEMAALNFMSREAYFDQLYEQLFWELYLTARSSRWQEDRFDPDNYKFQVIADGKLFKFFHLRNNEASPISWTKDGRRTWFSPVLTLINGEVKVGAM